MRVRLLAFRPARRPDRALFPPPGTGGRAERAAPSRQATTDVLWTGGPFLTSEPVRPVPRGRSVVRHLLADDRAALDRQLHGRDHDDSVLRGRRLRPLRLRPGRTDGRQLDLVRRPREGRAHEPAGGHVQRQHAGVARRSRRHLSGQGDAGASRRRLRPPTPAASSTRTTRPPRRRPSRCRCASSPSASRRASSTRRRCSARSRTIQRPGVLIPRGETSSGDQSPLFGAETLVNHGRNYYNDSKPFTVPYEYTWKPRFVYAPAAFTQGLFNGDEGELDDGRVREVREPPVPRGLQRHARRLPRHRRARGAEHARPLRRRREDRGLDRRELEGPARLGRSRPRQGPGSRTPATPSTSSTPGTRPRRGRS